MEQQYVANTVYYQLSLQISSTMCLEITDCTDCFKLRAHSVGDKYNQYSKVKVIHTNACYYLIGIHLQH